MPGCLSVVRKHELGHGSGWWNSAKPKIEAKIAALSGWVKEETVGEIISSAKAEALQDIYKGADDATFQWFKDNGFTVTEKLGMAVNQDGEQKQHKYIMEKK
jgi:hypothetical protein